MKDSKISITLAATALAVALFAATPISQAAGRLVLGKNSVGTAQLKRNAVTSAKVKDGSLHAADFKAGQLPAGPQGPQGPKGDRGPAGQTGATGPSNGYVHPWSQDQAYIDNGGGTVATLNLPPGKYLVFAKTDVATTFNGAVLVQCTLTAGSAYDYSSIDLHATSNQTGELNLNIGANLAAAGSATLWCRGNGSTTWARSTVLSAIRVGQLDAS